MVRAVIVTRRNDNFNIGADFVFDHLGNFAHGVVFVAHIVDFAVDLGIVPAQGFEVDIHHVCNVNIGAHLLAAKDGDLAVEIGVVGENIDGEIQTQTAMESGKPREIAEKMVEGRIRKWQEEVVLLKQPFVMNPDQTIEQLVAETAKETGSPVALKAFVRFALGEGVEKKVDDFAAEVASMTGQA